MKEAYSSNPQIKILEGEIKIHTDMEEASSSNPQNETLDDKLKKLTKERMELSKVDIGRYRPLTRAIQQNDVKAQKDFLDKNPDAMKAEIDEFGNTVFHLIVDQRSFNSEAVKLLKVLVSKVLVDSPATLEILNVANMTALGIAASAGNTEAVKVFVKKYKRLLIKEEEEFDTLAVHHAAKWGRQETVKYLLSQTGGWTEEFALDSGAMLLNLLIESNLHGVALEVLKHYPKLALPEENNFWNETVQMLSEKHLAFASGATLGFWENLIYQYIPLKDDRDHVAWPRGKSEDDDEEKQNPKCSTNCSVVAWPRGKSEDDDEEKQNRKCSTNCSVKFPTLVQIASTIDALKKRLWNALPFVPSIKDIHDQKLKHTQTLEIVNMMISKVNWTYTEASERLKKPVLTAARYGIQEFVNEVLKAYPNSGLFSDAKRQNIFILAVLYHKEKVFSLIHEQGVSIKDYNNYMKDEEDRNILHLAGKLVPSRHIPGAALQMQRELQWFKGIESHFQPLLQEQRNKLDKTPGDVFTEEHKELMEAGEKWMRDTATSCSVVAALIITIVFAAAFTVPGGINSGGIPNYLNETYFRIFAISLAISLFASTTSVQLFLGMLTSRYAEEDFLVALPRKLVIGLITLFMSSSSMMVAFGAAFCIALSHPWKWVIILICLLGCLPVTLFAWMQFPLLVDILKYTYGPDILKPTSSKRYRWVLIVGLFYIIVVALKSFL